MNKNKVVSTYRQEMNRRHFPFTPMHDRVLVEVIPNDGVLVKGKTVTIVLPENAAEMKSNIGMVIAVGNGKTKDDIMTVRQGDKIMYGLQYGTAIKIEGKDYLIMKQDLILFAYDDTADLGLRMVNDKILLLPDEIETKTKSGLTIPAVERDIPRRGTILSLGAKAHLETTDLNVGDKIHYYGNAGHFGLKIKDGKLNTSKEYIILQAPQILGVYYGKK